MKALEILNFSGCSGLKKFPDIRGNMDHLLELHLASTAIEELPSSIGHLTRLILLDLKSFKTREFPEVMVDMENLKERLLDGTYIEGLPSSIDRLKGLVLLNLRKCQNLVRACNVYHRLHADGTAITQPPDSIVLFDKLQVLIYPGLEFPSGLASECGIVFKIELPTDWTLVMISIGKEALFGQNTSGWVINHVPIERSSDRDGLHGSGMDSNSSGSSQGPLTVPRSSSSANTLKNDYHHPGAFFH
ncbi:TMV resistance protein N [Vitis vinifera]|uniref:TMV resistance protein N n=1 Tax=Vitis vinifera TaxID=29760 RepID=A0A438E149_VITVI|nr:TMV resistance protein N [Vitis vinifera]